MLKFINPYPGFYNGFHRSYEFEESDLFFGRVNDLKNLKIRFRKDKFVSVLSLPKAGKTSFLKAGLIPDLEKSNFSGIHGSKWTSIYFTPGSDPILNLARAISNPQSYSIQKIKPTKEEEVIAKLNKNDYGLIRVSEELISNRSSNILFIIDDFMEVFSPSVEEKRQLAFKQLLVKAAKAKGTAIYVMAVFNEEDINNIYLNQHKDLMKLVRQNNYKLRFLDQMSLMEAIVNPAKKEKCEVKEDLLYRLIEELLTDSDQLRKLQIYMHRSWFEWKKNHKDKYISLQHFQKATGTRSRTKIKTKLGASKGKAPDDHEEAHEPSEMIEINDGNLALSGIIGDYNNLNDANRKLYSQLIPLLVRRNDDEIYVSQPVEFNDAVEIIGGKDSNLIRMINSASSTFNIDKKKIKVLDADLITEWNISRGWLEAEENNIKIYRKLADASIMHYIEGIEVTNLIDKSDYTEIKLWFDDFKPTESWAKLHHSQYELAVDLIEKMEEIYGPVRKKLGQKGSGSKASGKKISLKIKSKKDEAVPKEEPELVTDEKEEEEIAAPAVETIPDDSTDMDDDDKAIAALLAGDNADAPKKPAAKKGRSTKAQPKPKPKKAVEPITKEEPIVESEEKEEAESPEKTPSAKEEKPKPKGRTKLNLKKSAGKEKVEEKPEEKIEEEKPAPAAKKKPARKKIVIKKR